MTPRDHDQRPPLRLVVDNATRRATHRFNDVGPPGLTAWDARFLRSLAGWPGALLPGQRAVLKWIADRVRVA